MEYFPSLPCLYVFTPRGAGRSSKDAPSIVLPHQNDYVSHIALDIGAAVV